MLDVLGLYNGQTSASSECCVREVYTSTTLYVHQLETMGSLWSMPPLRLWPRRRMRHIPVVSVMLREFETWSAIRPTFHCIICQKDVICSRDGLAPSINGSWFL